MVGLRMNAPGRVRWEILEMIVTWDLLLKERRRRSSWGRWRIRKRGDVECWVLSSFKCNIEWWGRHSWGRFVWSFFFFLVYQFPLYLGGGGLFSERGLDWILRYGWMKCWGTNLKRIQLIQTLTISIIHSSHRRSLYPDPFTSMPFSVCHPSFPFFVRLPIEPLISPSSMLIRPITGRDSGNLDVLLHIAVLIESIQQGRFFFVV